jgi:hypothetical protein
MGRLGQRMLGLLGCAAAGVFLEGASRLALRTELVLQRLPPGDRAWRLRWMSRRSQPDDYMAVDVYHPVRGWTLRPGLRDCRVFGNVLNSNSRGLRGRTEYFYEKVAGRARVLVFGDSFAFGEEVGDEETFARQLELRLDLEAPNFAVHGYGLDQMLLSLEEEGVRHQADLVMLAFIQDDLARTLLGFRDYAKPRFVLRGSELVLHGVPVPRPEALLRKERMRSGFVDLLGAVGQAVAFRLHGRPDRRAEAQALSTAILDRTCAITRSMGARPLLVYLPSQGEEHRTAEVTDGESFFLGYCSGRNVTCLNLRPVFRRRPAAGASPSRGGHWGRFEHGLAAEAMAPVLRELLAGLDRTAGADRRGTSGPIR